MTPNTLKSKIEALYPDCYYEINEHGNIFIFAAVENLEYTLDELIAEFYSEEIFNQYYRTRNND